MSTSLLRYAVFAVCFAVFSTAQAGSYRFISGSDLFEALSQDSMMLRGYFLGVVDVLKDSTVEECFQVPFSADADQQMVSSFLSYWQHTQLPEDPVIAIAQAMAQSYPCSPSLD